MNSGGNGTVRLGRARATVMGVVLSVVAAVGFGGSPATAQTGELGEIVVFHSDKVMDVVGGSTAAGAKVVQWEPNDTLNQFWLVFDLASVGDFELVLIASANAPNMVLDVAGGSTENGAELVQNPWAGEASQLWLLYPLGDTGYEIMINVKSGKVADVLGASDANGAAIVQWPWHGGSNQWWLTPVPFILADT